MARDEVNCGCAHCREHDQCLRHSLNQPEEWQREHVKPDVVPKDRILDAEGHTESPGEPFLPTPREEETDQCSQEHGSAACQRAKLLAAWQRDLNAFTGREDR